MTRAVLVAGVAVVVLGAIVTAPLWMRFLLDEPKPKVTECGTRIRPGEITPYCRNIYEN